jgi:hypothetical protein
MMVVNFRSRRIAAVTAVVLVVLGGIAIGVLVSGSSPPVAKKPTVRHAPPATFVGPDGVEATWVVKENDKPGTPAWKITDAPKTGLIQGFANLTAASDGQSVTLYVSSTAPSFRVQAYRMGYYKGAAARLVWQSGVVRGVVQANCPVTARVNMVACDNWKPSLKVRVTSAFVQGDYLFKLVGSENEQSYVPLTVWDPTSDATYLVKNDVFTWQAWNPYGGFDYYQGVGACVLDSATYPPCNRARLVSYDRPYGYGEGAADFLANELPLVRFAEQHGLDVTYGTDVTVEQHPTMLTHHRVLLSLGHDECWSLPERQAAVAAEKDGLNIVFFAASAMLRHVRSQSSPLGPDRELVDYRNSTEDPLDAKGNPLQVTGNAWSDPPANWPETGFVGATYAGYLTPGAKALPLVVADAVPWLFRGTGLHTGSIIPRELASDFDQFETSMPFETDEEILGHSSMKSPSLQTNSAGGGATAYSDMTYYTDPKSHAGVFDTGTNNWIPSLQVCVGRGCRQRTIARMTGNLLLLFGKGPAGDFQPSSANWQKIYH